MDFKKDLVENILPFWLENAIDYANGLNYYSKRIYDEVNKKMHEQDVKVFRILDDKEYYEQLQKERQDTLKREHDEWIAEQSKDPRWKVCKRAPLMEC